MGKTLSRNGLKEFFADPMISKPQKETIERQNVPIRKEAHAQLRIIAANKGVKLQEVIDAAIAAYLKKNN